MSAQKSQIELYYSLKFALWDKALTILLTTPPHPSSFYQSFPIDDRRWHALHWACCHTDTPRDVIHHLLSNFPHDAIRTVDYDGDTPLHVAIREFSSSGGAGSSSSSSSSAIIRDLVMHCPAVVMMANKWGYTPLHTACSWDSATDVIRVLLEAAEANDGDGVGVMGAVDSFGKTPWRCFVEHWNLRLRHVIGCYNDDNDDRKYCSEWFDTTEVLLSSDSSTSSLTVRDIYDQTCHLLRAITKENNNNQNDNNDDDDDDDDEDCSSSSSSQSWYPLHASLTIPDCPWSLTHLLLLAHPEHASLPSDGWNLPLHLALAAASSFSSSDDDTSYYNDDDGAFYRCCGCKDETKTDELLFNHVEDVVYCFECLECLESIGSFVGNRCDYRLITPESKMNNIMSHILSIHPTSAHLPNLQGQLPLTLALLLPSANGARMVDDVVIQHIFDLAPTAIATRDVRSHLYPFMTAAVGAAVNNRQRRQSCGSDEDEEEEEEDNDDSDDDNEAIGDNVIETREQCLNDVTCVFDLLMKDPTLVSLGIPYRGIKRKEVL